MTPLLRLDFNLLGCAFGSAIAATPFSRVAWAMLIPQAAFIAAASLAVYKPAFTNLFEIKHYGLEILACLCIIVWVA